MSLILKASYRVPSNELDTLVVKELTNQWSALYPGGWDPTGVNNPKTSEATTAEISIALRNSDGTFGTETVVDVYSDLPSDDGGEVEILAEDAGYESEYADGVYRFKYTTTGVWVSNANVPFVASKTVYVPIIPNICKCIDSIAIQAAKCTCNCEKINAKYSKIMFYMRLLEKAYKCADLDSMQKFIDLLTKLCNCGC